ncbi:MAG: alpha-amylase family glycosyl hydrolase [Lysobacteraceae bacterium]
MSLRPVASFTITAVLTLCACSNISKGVVEHRSEISAPNPCGADYSEFLHRPSPDWRDQVIYFVMTDRFADGDPDNNDQGQGEYDPTSPAHYSGGDLRGLCEQLDYIQQLGATAVWITPPVLNQWWDGEHGFSGYHGYWASDFGRVDPHVGTLADYQALSSELHRRGMALVQDVVLNHTGNYFHYDREPSVDDVSEGYRRNRDSRPTSAPAQWPFSLNDPEDPAQLEAAIYHWTPTIRDFNDRDQELRFQLSDLDDLNTKNPFVRNALFDSYAGWIRQVGVDAFRIDTAFYVTPALLQDFAYSADPQHPGMREVAKAQGAGDFLLFGEGFGKEKPFEDVVESRINHYLRDEAGESVLPGMLDFPLYSALGDVFARGQSTAILAHRLQRLMRRGQDPGLQPRFIDNHDVDRFLAGGSETGLGQALLMLMTLPGIPVIYYGTEQGFRGQRDSMFAAGHGSRGVDHFDQTAPLYRQLQRIIALRHSDPLFRRGTPVPVYSDASGPGALVYLIDFDGKQMLVALNSADHRTLAAPIDARLPDNSKLSTVFRLDEQSDDSRAHFDPDGRLLLELAPHAGVVWEVQQASEIPAATDSVVSQVPRLEPVPGIVRSGELSVHGTGEPDADLRLLLDGNMERAAEVRVSSDGHWQASIDLDGLVDPDAPHRLQLWSPAQNRVSESRTFHVQPDWRTVAVVEDPPNDDAGPSGRYRYPLDQSWAGRHLGDIRRVGVQAWKGSLRIAIDMAELVAVWNPPNGFDHLSLTVFLELPARDDGSTVMPRQDGELPDGMRWHYRWRLGGWTVSGFSSEGADTDSEGQPLKVSPLLEVDREHERILLTIPAASIGRPADLAGARIWINSWDFDGDYRPLNDEPGGYQFGSGDGPAGAKWMDASPILQIDIAE